MNVHLYSIFSTIVTNSFYFHPLLIPVLCTSGYLIKIKAPKKNNIPHPPQTYGDRNPFNMESCYRLPVKYMYEYVIYIYSWLTCKVCVFYLWEFFLEQFAAT